MAEPSAPLKRTAAVVYNPTKVDLQKLRRSVGAAEHDAGWARTLWFETTAADGGLGAAETALRAGAAVVLAAGGDGTARAVAQSLRGTEVPMAILPLGTGNLLARNLGLPLGNLDASAAMLFSSNVRRIDLGIADIQRDDADATPEKHAFLVMAGLGLDAKLIAKTNSKLKKAVGWLAYVDAGVRALPETKPVRLRYRMDEGAEKALTAHTIIVGNCGALPGGILLFPDAEPDDGLLDVAALRPRGPLGWVKVWNKVTWENAVLRKSATGRKITDLGNEAKDVTYITCRALTLTVEEPQEFQLDGDEFGTVKSVDIVVDPGGLAVKVP